MWIEIFIEDDEELLKEYRNNDELLEVAEKMLKESDEKNAND